MTEDEFKKSDDMTKMELNSPITDEQWNIITDAELEHSDEIEFTTPSGKKVVYAKVRHGKWIYTGFMEVKCNNCGNVFHELEDTNYCPACGCHMDDVVWGEE